jgi:hypothetical protein
MKNNQKNLFDCIWCFEISFVLLQDMDFRLFDLTEGLSLPVCLHGGSLIFS